MVRLLKMKFLQTEGISQIIFFNGSLISSNVAYHDLVCIQDLFVMGDCACVNHWNGVFYIKRRQTNEI